MDIELSPEEAFDMLEKISRGAPKPGDTIVVECESIEQRESLKAFGSLLLERGFVKKIVAGGADKKELHVVIYLR